MDTPLLSHVSNDVLIVDFQQTEILDQSAVDSVGKELRQLALDSDCTKVLLDMSRIELMTSAMIGQFVSLHNEAQQRGVDLRFCNLSNEISELFGIMKLDTIFNLRGSREEAMESF